jgi:hypothetical protein
VVVSGRIAQVARDLGLAGEILVSRAASDADILDAVLAWQASHKAP